MTLSWWSCQCSVDTLGWFTFTQCSLLLSLDVGAYQPYAICLAHSAELLFCLRHCAHACITTVRMVRAVASESTLLVNILWYPFVLDIWLSIRTSLTGTIRKSSYDTVATHWQPPFSCPSTTHRTPVFITPLPGLGRGMEYRWSFPPFLSACPLPQSCYGLNPRVLSLWECGLYFFPLYWTHE